MNIKKKSLNVLLVLILIIGSQQNGKAQFQIGLEAGTTIATLQHSMGKSHTQFKYRIGTRAGVNVAIDIHKFLYLRSGLFYSLEGSSTSSSSTFTSLNLHTLSLPIMGMIRPIKQLHFGAGIDLGALLNPSSEALKINPITIGIRFEVVWQINDHLRIMGHFSKDLTPSIAATITTNYMPSLNPPYIANYSSMEGGLSLAYTLFKTKPKK